ncbi:MAG TPA: hypothetical protein VK872_10180 [Draconibacterium sp.]|jgi:hypothetical protein|nr:hypothetical protein [Draconibacterium sp.]
MGCKYDNFPVLHIPDGTYTGTFQRELVWSKSDTAQVTLTFSSNNWYGESDKVKYPALCNGTYSIDGNKINFNSGCAWSAEFDWSLILSGEYTLTITGNTIEFSRDYRSATSDTYVDKYKLTKKE